MEISGFQVKLDTQVAYAAGSLAGDPAPRFDDAGCTDGRRFLALRAKRRDAASPSDPVTDGDGRVRREQRSTCGVAAVIGSTPRRNRLAVIIPKVGAGCPTPRANFSTALQTHLFKRIEDGNAGILHVRNIPSDDRHAMLQGNGRDQRIHQRSRMPRRFGICNYLRPTFGRRRIVG